MHGMGEMRKGERWRMIDPAGRYHLLVPSDESNYVFGHGLGPTSHSSHCGWRTIASRQPARNFPLLHERAQPSFRALRGWRNV